MPDPADAGGRRLLEVGTVARAHGLKGEVIVALVTDRTERVAAGSVLSSPGGDLTVLHSTAHHGRFIVAFAGTESREQAEALRGLVLSAPPLDDADVLWVHELVGRRVQSVDGTDHGAVVAVEANPASDLLVLDGGGLVPLCFVVDQRDGRVVIDPPAGLLD
ncbi:MAG: ribosome maturation factor RimM [Acidimicrobiales bacterium]